MKTQRIGKSWIAHFFGLVLTLCSFAPSLPAQVLHLKSGTNTVNSSQATCDTAFLSMQNGKASEQALSCSDGQLTMNLTAATVAIVTVDISAYSRLVVQFQVDAKWEEKTGGDASTLPVLIGVPVSWKGGLLNTNVIPPSGPLDNLAGYADVNGVLYLAPGVALEPDNVGATIASNNFMAATHTGVTGCLTVPKTPVQGALMVGKCAAALFKKEEGNGTIYLAGMIQVGETYDVVLELDGHIHTDSAVTTGIPQTDFIFNIVTNDIVDPSLGLFWSGPMTITIGTDFQGQMARLREEIGDLQKQVNILHTEFLQQTHNYSTGQGVAQNNTAPPRRSSGDTADHQHFSLVDQKRVY